MSFDLPILYPDLARLIDELISEDGEPYEDGITIIQYILKRALSPAGRGGMGTGDAIHLEHILKATGAGVA